jgi:hypothetical protein
MQAYINDIQINPHHVSYDEHYYKKYAEDTEIHPLMIRIELKDFNEKMQPEYEALLRELVEDDLLTGENYALELFETLTAYPSYEDILNDTAISMKEKMGFLTTFFISQIFNAYLRQENTVESRHWIIREVLYFNKNEDHIIIKGNVQKTH